MAPEKSNIDLVKECDNFPYVADSPNEYQKVIAQYYQFRVAGIAAVLGYVERSTVQRMPLSTLWELDHEQQHVVLQTGISSGSSAEAIEGNDAELARYWQEVREKKIFEVLKGWRDELYPVYGPCKTLLLRVERSVAPLLGVTTYGVHMTAFVRSTDGMKIWAPRRAPTKQTYPNMLDNTVAGGLASGEQPLQCLIREAAEEASLPEHVVRTATACGTVTYFHVRDARAGGETGLCQPECQFTYDLELPDDLIPKPGDNEAIDFRLLNVLEVQKAMATGEFKPNCALVLLDFFVRHGIVTPEDEPNYIEIVARLHRKLEFPTF